MAATALFRFRIFASNLSLHSVNLRVNLVALSETTNIMINSFIKNNLSISFDIPLKTLSKIFYMPSNSSLSS